MKIGIVGSGGIVSEALKSFAKIKVDVTALWCRTKEKGEKVLQGYDVSAVYTDYDAFLKDDSFDTVYIGLVNSAHYEYAKKALSSGKHVIVEKPLTSTYYEAQDLVNTAEENHVMLFEAILLRYSANYEGLMQYLDQLGDLKLITSTYCQYSRRYDAYLEGKVLPAFDPELSGGSLYDINVYNVHLIVGLFGAPRYSYYMANTGYNGIDTSGVLLMDYGQFKAVCIGAKDCAADNGTVLTGTQGTLTIPDRPGFVGNVILHDRISGVEKCIDAVKDEDPMSAEFRKIAETIDAGAYAQAAMWMQRSLQVMSVLENARMDAGIEFAADETAEEPEEIPAELAGKFKSFLNR